ncbi:hypothetical protein [Roseimicrobium sp. ORNL1]|uniref:hypothetical protein n=1 Tax=Roseimicrobium sp. ORNL1 TaxID=2711231 RepID=UPI0013E0FC16|nr:hypothetical protein [Roseimicrobium sp. ORNL1]QIF03294.1 hypothetical protein G5S37_17775 [Roseimicrobium sp. ORNL1]
MLPVPEGGGTDEERVSDILYNYRDASIFIDPVLKGTEPRLWSRFEELRISSTELLVMLPKTATALVEILRREIVRAGLDFQSRLTESLASSYGDVPSWDAQIEEWKAQFGAFGVLSYGDAILSCVEVIDRGELRKFFANPTIAYSVLTRTGSDLEIVRQMQSCLGGDHEPLRLLEFVRVHHTERGVVHVVTDSLHSGSQALEQLMVIIAECREFAGVVQLFPLHATRWGVRNLLNQVKKNVRTFEVKVDLTQSFVVENVKEEGEGVRRLSELELRLEHLGYPDSFIQKIVKFSRDIGACLKQQEDGLEFPDRNVGLGGWGLGLTSMVDCYPGKAMLPLLRLSGIVEISGGASKKVLWRGLLVHKNASGAG